MTNGPHDHYEQAWLSQGFSAIAGVDEVGRGPLAGPVVAAAVILDLAQVPAGLDDSKALNALSLDHGTGPRGVCCLPPGQRD